MIAYGARNETERMEADALNVLATHARDPVVGMGVGSPGGRDYVSRSSIVGYDGGIRRITRSFLSKNFQSRHQH